MASVEPKRLYQSQQFIIPDRYSVQGDPGQKTLTWHKRKLEALADRIESCPKLSWGHVHCRGCDIQLSKKPIKLSCLSQFCKDPECMKTRIRIRYLHFQDLNIKSKNLYSFVIGFKDIPVKELTNKYRSKSCKIVKQIITEIKKIYGKFYYIAGQDQNKSENGNVRLHYHISTLPLKDFRMFVFSLDKAIKTIQDKTGDNNYAYSLSGYKKTNAVLNYLAKRTSGIFGHDRKGEQKFTYADLMNLKQFREVFFGTKRFFTNLIFRERKLSELIFMLNNIPKICPNCKTSTYKNTYFKSLEEIEADKHKPPDISTNSRPEMKIEIVAMIPKHKCLSCGQSYYLEDFVKEDGICAYCKFAKKHAPKKMFSEYCDALDEGQEIKAQIIQSDFIKFCQEQKI